MASLPLTIAQNVSDKVTENREQYRKENKGKEAIGKAQDTLIAGSYAAGIFDVVGDRLVGDIGKLTPKQFNKLTKSKVGRVLARPGSLAVAAAGEFVAESGANALSSYAVKQDIDKLDYEGSYVAGMIGFGSGGITAGVMQTPRTILDTTRGAAKVANKIDENQKKKAQSVLTERGVQSQKGAAVQGVQTKEVESINEFDPSDVKSITKILEGAQAIQNASKNEQAKDEASLVAKATINSVKGYIEDLVNAKAELQKELDDGTIKSKKEIKKAERELKVFDKAISLRQEILNKFEAETETTFKNRSLSQKDIQNIVKDLNLKEAQYDVANNTTDFATRNRNIVNVVLAQIISEPELVDSTSAYSVLNSENAKLTEGERDLLTVHANIQEAIEKSKDIVSDNIINGDQEFRGIKQYRQSIISAIGNGRIGEARGEMLRMARFVDYMNQKAQDFNDAKASGKYTQFPQYTQYRGPNAKGAPMFYNPKALASNVLVDAINKDAAFLNNVRSELNDFINRASKPKQQQGTPNGSGTNIQPNSDSTSSPDNGAGDAGKGQTGTESGNTDGGTSVSQNPAKKGSEDKKKRTKESVQTPIEDQDNSDSSDVSQSEESDKKGKDDNTDQTEVDEQQQQSETDQQESNTEESADTSNQANNNVFQDLLDISDKEGIKYASTPEAEAKLTDADKLFQRTNLLLAYFTPINYRKSEYPNHFAVNPEALQLIRDGKANEVFGRDLSQQETNALNAMMEFVDVFVEDLDNSWKPRNDPTKRFDHGVEFFVKEGETTLPQYVKEGLALAAFDWITTLGSRTTFNDADSINQLLRQDEKTLPTDVQWKALSRFGSQRESIIDSIGSQSLNTLGIKPNGKNAPKNVNENIKASLGLAAYNTLMHMNVLVGTEISIKELNDLGGFYILDNDYQTIQGARLTLEDDVGVKGSGGRALKRVMDTVDNGGGIVQKLLGNSFEGKEASIGKPLPKHKYGKTVLKNSGGQLAPEKAVDNLNAYEENQWFMNFNMTKVSNVLGVKNIANMLGRVNPQNSIKATLDSVEGKNRTIKFAIDNYIKFVKRMEQTVGKENKFTTPIYFASELGKQMRAFMTSSDVNPQREKFHRYMLNQKETTISFEDSTLTEYFLVCVAQGLGIDTDKQPNLDSVTEVKELLKISCYSCCCKRNT